MVKIYDSATNKKIELQEPVTMYCCGPTVYNHVHIGNIRPIITFDVLCKLLDYLKVPYKFVHNITDIDDKIINAAKTNKVNELDLSNKYFLEYLKILKALNIKPMDMPKVSENMNGLIDYINKLVQSKHAYVSDGDVYLDVRSIPQYGFVSHQNIDQLMSGVRKENSKNKHSDIDFALWKQTSEGLNWDSPWSKGRPGWHSECGYFINKYFGKQVQIHGGGIDLKFPHHENENAQNLALNGVNVAKTWMHVGHIQINNQKMAKSLGNFILAKDFLAEYSSNTIRWFMYQTQYENPINFSKEFFKQLTDDFNRIIKTINQTYIDLAIKNLKVNDSLNIADKEFIEALENDLDFPNALKVIYRQVKSLRSLFSKKDLDGLSNTLSALQTEFKILGIVYTSILTPENISLINEWSSAIKDKNYTKADEIRNSFQSKGII